MPAAVIPALYAAGAIGGGIASYKAAKSASKPSAQEQAAFQTQSRASDALSQQGAQLTNFGMPLLQKAGNYYSTLAGGNRAATEQALAPEVQNINDTYAGTQRTLSRFLKGPDRDYQTGELARQRAGAVGSLFTGARERGINGLVNLGTYGTSQGGSAYGGAAGIAGSLAASGQQNRVYGNQMQQQAGASTAQLLFSLLQMYSGRGGGSGGGSLMSSAAGGSSPFIG